MAIKSLIAKATALFDIRTIARRSVAYTILITAIALVFFSAEFLVEKFLYHDDEVVDIAAAVLGAFAFAELRSVFEKFTDNTFFRGQYDYAEAVEALNALLCATIDLEEILRLIANLIAKTIQPEVIIFLLSDSQEPITFHHPKTRCEHIAATIPFISKGDAIATMMIGEKLSGGGMERKDLQLLQVISHQAGMAIENAKLYEALRERSENLERRVAEKTERIKEMYDAQSKFMTDLAHEFQTPLSILQGNIAILSKSERARRANAVYVAVTTLDRLSRLVTNLLDIAKLNFSRDRFNQQMIDVKALLAEAVEDCTILAEDKNISLTLSSEPISVAGDRDKLKEVLLNLVSNALKHTPAGGLISLAAKRDGENVEISVTDTGKGISPENLPQIFERFYKIDKRGLSDGNGIGLHICRRIVEAHQGTIVVESEPGRGSRFTVHLPVAYEKGHVIINECSQP